MLNQSPAFKSLEITWLRLNVMIFTSAVFLLSSWGKQLQGYSVKQAQNTCTQLALCLIFSHKSGESERVAVAKSKCRYFLSLLMRGKYSITLA